MKLLGIIGLCAVSLVAVACSAGSNEAASSSTNADTAGSGVLVCTGGDTQIGVLPKGLVTMTKTGALLALASDQTTALTLSADKTTGAWKHGTKTLAVTCAAATDATGWTAAGQMAAYADSVTDLAEGIFEEEAEGDDDGATKASTDSAAGYTVFAVLTADVASLDLGTVPADSKGALAGGDDDADTLYDDDNSYGGLSAAYGLGDGDDWGEYFQGASDGISIPDSLGDTRASYQAHENAKAFDGLLQSTGASAVEVTVGAWTFLAPSDFAKSE